MFDQWQRSPASAPVQLRFLLATAAECRSSNGILCLAVFSSPRFSDSEFTKTLLNCLANIIHSSDRGMKDLAMLCFCVLCAIDPKVALPEELFNSLRQRFKKRRSPLVELWDMVMPEASDMLHGFGRKPETITKLRVSLSQPQFTSALDQEHLFWASDALDQTVNPPIPEEWRFSPKARSKRPAKESEEEASIDEWHSIISLS